MSTSLTNEIGVALLFGPVLVADAQVNGRFNLIADRVTHWTRHASRLFGLGVATSVYLLAVVVVWWIAHALIAHLGL